MKTCRKLSVITSAAFLIAWLLLTMLGCSSPAPEFQASKLDQNITVVTYRDPKPPPRILGIILEILDADDLDGPRKSLVKFKELKSGVIRDIYVLAVSEQEKQNAIGRQAFFTGSAFDGSKEREDVAVYGKPQRRVYLFDVYFEFESNGRQSKRE